MSQVLIVTTNYWPEPTGIAVYTTDLAETLQQNGQDVSVLTSLPHYPWWHIPSEYSHLGEGASEHNKVSVMRANHLIPTEMDALKRMRFEFSLWWNLRRVSKRLNDDDIYVVISCIPTVAAGVVGRRLAKKFKVPFGLIVQDLSGAGAKQSGLRGGNGIAKVAEYIETSVVRAADRVVVVSPAMGDAVLRMGVPAEQLKFIPNYSAREIHQHDMREARERFGWDQSDFIVIHTGNMGAKQGLENVVAASMLLKTDSNIKIYLVGHGNREKELKEISAGLKNIEVLPAVSDEVYPFLLSAADLLLVSERPTQMDMSLPSKLTSYLFSSKPVLAAVPSGGATWKYLDGIAELIEAGQPEALANAIENLIVNHHRREELSRLGYAFADANLDTSSGRARYLEWVNRLIENK